MSLSWPFDDKWQCRAKQQDTKKRKISGTNFQVFIKSPSVVSGEQTRLHPVGREPTHSKLLQWTYRLPQDHTQQDTELIYDNNDNEGATLDERYRAELTGRSQMRWRRTHAASWKAIFKTRRLNYRACVEPYAHKTTCQDPYKGGHYAFTHAAHQRKERWEKKEWGQTRAIDQTRSANWVLARTMDSTLQKKLKRTSLWE